MGLFGSTKTIITVASTVYNMSGDYDNTDKWFKAVIISGILQNVSVADTIIGNLFSCPKSRFNKFFNYTLNNNYKGNLITKINSRKKVDVDVIIDYLDPDVGTYVNIEKAFIDYDDGRKKAASATLHWIQLFLVWPACFTNQAPWLLSKSAWSRNITKIIYKPSLGL